MRTYIFLLCLLLAIGVNSFTAAKAQVNIKDSLVLVDLYRSTNGPRWRRHDNWLTKMPVSTWYGITVFSGRNRVEQIFLNNNRLTGRIPTSIGNLEKLVYLSLSQNQLSGKIPLSIGNLSNLEALSLYDNQLSGTIPASIEKLTILQGLSIGKNYLSGSIPSFLGHLLHLQHLSLQSNQLSSSIPSAIGNLVNLIDLDLSNNQLSGHIPLSFRKLKSIFTLNLNNNQFTQDNNVDFQVNDRRIVYMNVSFNYYTFDGLEFLAKVNSYAKYSPQAPIHIHQHNNSLSVYAGGTLSNNTYKWFMIGSNDSTIITGDSTFTPAQSGKYYVQVLNAIVTYPNPLSNRHLILQSDTITYIAPQQNSISSFAKSSNTHFSFYPNPASNIIHLRTTGTAIITITNSAGKVLLTKNINNNADINVSTLANDVYYVQNKTTGEVQKMVVTH